MGFKIAVIGWGSLIWKPGSENAKLNLMDCMWKKNGPKLPVEYGRISSKDRLTLVLVNNAEPIQTYWTTHKDNDLQTAKNNLASREGTVNGNIEAVFQGDIQAEGIKGVVASWLGTINYDAAIYTNLKSNFKAHFGQTFSPELAVAYLKDLNNREIAICAKEYFVKTPPQIITVTSKKIADGLGWEREGISFFDGLIEP